jgi:ribosomal protein S18 acetylase RimI-like enzyme
MARVIIDSRRDAHRDHIPEESLMRFTYGESERNWARSLQEIESDPETKSSIYVAEEPGGEIVGVAMGGPERSDHPLYAGEVYILYLLPQYQRQGLGRALTRAVVTDLLQRGMSSLMIRVLKANAQARKLYEALGGQLVLEEQIEEDGALLDQVGYGWTDVNILLREPER